MMTGEIPTDDGVVVTDGFVLIHSAAELGRKSCKATAVDSGGVLRSRFITAYNTPVENIYTISEPFELKKVASTLRNLCKQYQATNRFKQSFITFIGTHNTKEPIAATFNVRHLVNAFDCVGRTAQGVLCQNPELFNGMAFLLIEPAECPNDLRYGIHAIVMQSKCMEGV